jgi:hypothetical protein
MLVMIVMLITLHICRVARHARGSPTCANEPAHASDNVNHARPCKVQEAVAPSVHGEKKLLKRKLGVQGRMTSKDRVRNGFPTNPWTSTESARVPHHIQDQQGEKRDAATLT